MRTRKYRGGKRRSMKAGRRKSYRGGQPRWPAPSNPTPAPSCWFPHFRPLLLSQFGGRKKSKRKQRKSKRKQRKSRKHKGANGDSPTSVIDGPYSPPQHPDNQGNQSLAEQYGFGGLNEYGSMQHH